MKGYEHSTIPFTWACTGCGVLATDIELHDKWCPAKEHDRKMVDYEKVFKTQEVEVTALEPRDYPADGHVTVQGMEIPIHRVRFDHKEP